MIFHAIFLISDTILFIQIRFTQIVAIAELCKCFWQSVMIGSRGAGFWFVNSMARTHTNLRVHSHSAVRWFYRDVFLNVSCVMWCSELRIRHLCDDIVAVERLHFWNSLTIRRGDRFWCCCCFCFCTFLMLGRGGIIFFWRAALCE